MKVTYYTPEEISEIRHALMMPIKNIPTRSDTATSPCIINEFKEVIEKKVLTLDSVIVIIDDSDFVRKVLRHALIEYGFHSLSIVEAKNGEEGIEVMMEFPHAGLIITDIHMPKIDGLDFTATVRSHKTMRDIHIWVLSADMSETTLQNFSKYDVELIPKPFKKQMFFDKLLKIAPKHDNHQKLNKDTLSITHHHEQLLIKKKNLQTKISRLEDEIFALNQQIHQLDKELKGYLSLPEL